MRQEGQKPGWSRGRKKGKSAMSPAQIILEAADRIGEEPGRRKM